MQRKVAGMSNTYNVIRVNGYNCPAKHLISVNNKPAVFTNSLAHANQCLGYLTGGIEKEQMLNLSDKKFIGILDKIKEGDWYA